MTKESKGVQDGEREAVEVVGYLIGGMVSDKPCSVRGVLNEPLMTVAQYSRIVAAKDAEIARWKAIAASPHDARDVAMEIRNELQAELTAQQGASVAVPEGWRSGVEAVAKMVEKKSDAFAMEYGHDDMGGLSFGSGAHADAKADYHSSLIELVDEILDMLAAAPKPAAADECVSDGGTCGLGGMCKECPHLKPAAADVKGLVEAIVASAGRVSSVCYQKAADLADLRAALAAYKAQGGDV